MKKFFVIWLVLCFKTYSSRAISSNNNKIEVQEIRGLVDPHTHIKDSESADDNLEFNFELIPFRNSEVTFQVVGPQLASATEDHNKVEKTKVGLSSGGSLVNIARGAAQAAHISLGNQPVAAGQAAFTAKNRLAQSAAQSAAIAAAALAGKQIILQGLEQQTYNAKRALEGEQAQLIQAQRAATSSANAANQAMRQVQVITTALNAAQSTSQHASQAAAEAAAELAAQTTMVGAAKARVTSLEDQLALARIDFEAAQSASNKATQAAQTAQNNAADAAAQAAEIARAYQLHMQNRNEASSEHNQDLESFQNGSIDEENNHTPNTGSETLENYDEYDY